MDALNHMLTDPLGPKEECAGHITEECTLGSCRVSLPEDLLEDVGSATHSPAVDYTCLPASFAVQMFTNVSPLVPNSRKFSSPWWAKAPGARSCRILRESTFVSFCHSFLKTMPGSKRAPSAIYSIMAILTLETPFILHRNYSEVLLAFLSPTNT